MDVLPKRIILMKHIFYFSLFLITATFTFSSCTEKKYSSYENRGWIFKTSYSVKYEYSRSLQKEIKETLALFDDSMNPFKESSVISKVNRNEPVKVDYYFTTVFNKAQEVSKVSGGLFDITSSPLISAWGFGFGKQENITPQLIDSLKTFIGYEKINLLDGMVHKTDSRIQINASAIAKGYAVDVIGELLESHGIDNYMVEIGGEIRTKGVNKQKNKWRVGIDRPTADSIPRVDFQYIIGLSGKSMATSGDYRRFYIKDGHKYAHTIHPHTGYPADNGILSASVIADDCMTADAYATVFMLADTAMTRKIAIEQKLSYLLIMAGKDGDYRIVKSTDFDTYIIE